MPRKKKEVPIAVVKKEVKAVRSSKWKFVKSLQAFDSMKN